MYRLSVGGHVSAGADRNSEPEKVKQNEYPLRGGKGGDIKRGPIEGRA